VGIPITYGTLNNDIKAGLGLRFGGFFAGSDDMLAAFSNNVNSFNVYFGAFVPISKKKIKDRDHDKVSDRMDLCPTIPGELSAHGCPDKDHDGVADMDDRCPDDSGVVELQGCPDKDDDGVPDIDDKCPDVPGLEQFNGCPDADGDGVPDNEDLCPTIPGSVQFHGCPDTDNDGVPDNIDQCPNIPGPASNHGCPIETKAKQDKAAEMKMPGAKQKIERAAQALEFESGKAVIKKTSLNSLNEVVKVLKENPDSYMTIDGYTDNVGSPEKNIHLSEARADAVKTYFVKHGINAGRLISTGHGETNPIAPNTTTEGRAKNRRVVMEMKGK
jgi:outer membrane protein OmpA-like peptidoglycan-associated protein